MHLDSTIGASVDLFGKTASDLQSGITIDESTTPARITGTSKHIANYSGAGFDATKGTNFVVLHATAQTGATITATTVGDDERKQTLDSDGIIILQINDKTTGVTFTATKDNVVESKTYIIDKLVLKKS